MNLEIRFIRYFFVIYFLTPSQSFSQRQAENWYFGNYAGVNFSSGSPVAVSGGQTNTNEGVATISDSIGNLLFYTDGITVWNKLHQVMQNGTGLFGNPSSTQSAIIVPQPGNDSIYYVFTVDYYSQPHGICYSIVNMNVAGGLGAVITKNIQLLTPTCEKLTAVHHCNRKDTWVITKQFNTDKYYAWLVNSSGISTTPVISATGNIVNISAGTGSLSVTEGYLKASPDGKKILAAHVGYCNELGKFDNSTGIISDVIKISSNPMVPVLDTAQHAIFLNYGVEFSPDSRLVYIDIGGFYFPTGSSPIPAFIIPTLNQYDITSHDSSIIAQSHYIVDSASYPQFTQVSASEALQLGIDNKIYRTDGFTNFLSVINDPNIPGAGCNYQNDAINLGSGIARVGLPSFISSFFNTRTFTSNNNCSSLTTQFQINNTAGIDSVKWDFNDIASGINNNSTLTDPSHTFSAPGNYMVSLFIYTSSACGNFIDTISKNVPANAIHVNLGNDITLCQNDSIILNSGIANAAYLWNDGSTDSILNVFQPGSYWVTVSFQGCFSSDTINITGKSLPHFTLGTDTLICSNVSFSLSAQPNFIDATYLWSNNATDSLIYVTSANNYWLLLTDTNGCKWRDTIYVSIKPAVNFSLGRDTSICEGSRLILQANSSGATGYLWNTSASTSQINVDQPGIYWCDLYEDGCIYRDSIQVLIKPLPIVNLGADSTLCENQTLLLTATNINAVYLWQDGSANSFYTVFKSGLYWVNVTLNGCENKDTIKVDFKNCNCFPSIPNAFTPNGDGINDKWIISHYCSSPMTVSVYNRYGSMIYHSDNYQNDWNGTYRSRTCPDGTYYYVLRLAYSSQEFKIFKGNITILR